MRNTERNERMPENIVELPRGFIGKQDEAKLESFGGYLIAHGLATRWHWRREEGIDVAFVLFGVGGDFLCSIRRDQERDVFYVAGADGRRKEEGTLEGIMALVERLAIEAAPGG